MSLLSALFRKKLIIFDLDGTLIDLAVDWSALKKKLSMMFSKHYGDDCSFNSISKCLSHIVDKRDEPILKEFFQVIEEYENKEIEKSQPIEESIYFLNHLSEFVENNTVKIAIMSLNTRRTIQNSINLMNLNNKIDFYVGREDVRRWKPNPDGLLKILEHFNINKLDAIYVGDMKKDLIAGEKAGIDSYLIEDLKEIVKK